MVKYLNLIEYINSSYLGGKGPRGRADDLDEILEFNYETETWNVIGVMKKNLRSLAVSVVPYDEYAKWCN